MVSDFPGRGSGPSATPSLDPRILILDECADITENLLTGMLRIKSNKIKTIIMNLVQFAYVL